MFEDLFLYDPQGSNPSAEIDSSTPPLPNDYESVDQAFKPPPDIFFDYAYYIPDLKDVRESWTEDRAFYPSVITYGLTFGLGLAGNLLVVVALFLDRKSQGVTSAFLVSLAFADLLFLVICVPYELISKFLFYWIGGKVLCKVAGFTEMLTGFASVLNLTAVSVERYCVIVHPMKSRSWCTVGNAHKTIASVWIVGLILSSPTLHVMDMTVGLYHDNRSYVTTMTCADSNFESQTERIVFVWYQMIVMFLIPVVVMTYCYAVVIRVLWLSNRQSTASSGGPSEGLLGDSRPRFLRVWLSETNNTGARRHNTEVREARKQIVRMLIVIVLLFLFCWGPRLILSVMRRHQASILHSDEAFVSTLLINLLPYVQSCVNPIVYSFMSSKFRRSMRNACRCRCAGAERPADESTVAMDTNYRSSGRSTSGVACKPRYKRSDVSRFSRATSISVLSEQLSLTDLTKSTLRRNLTGSSVLK